MQTDRQTDRQTDIQTDSLPDTHTNNKSAMHIDGNIFPINNIVIPNYIS